MTINSMEEMLGYFKNIFNVSSSLLAELEEFDEARDDFLKSLSDEEVLRIASNPHYMHFARLIIALQYVERPECGENITILRDNIEYNVEHMLTRRKK